MITLIYGGSGSGKSGFAEDFVCKTTFANRYYLATMSSQDTESINRIARHRKLRNGKNFITLEYPVNIANAISDIALDAIVLLECMSNLVANEMFSSKTPMSWEECANKILTDIKSLEDKVGHLVIVTNNIFEDGNTYDEWTKEYMRSLGMINRSLAKRATECYEVVVGIGIKI